MYGGMIMNNESENFVHLEEMRKIMKNPVQENWFVANTELGTS
jgi:hypothetical protein